MGKGRGEGGNGRGQWVGARCMGEVAHGQKTENKRVGKRGEERVSGSDRGEGEEG